MRSTHIRLTCVAAGVLLAAALGACDAPTHLPHAPAAVAGGPSLLVTPSCAGTGGQTHAAASITSSQTWTRATSPHRVTGWITINTGGLLILQPGVVVCFEPGTGMQATNGGRLNARGRDTARIVFTARDPARAWSGLRFQGSPALSSYLTNVRIEHVHLGEVGVSTNDYHPVYLDSAVIRQSGRAAELRSPGSRLSRSRVDTTTYRNGPAVVLANGARFDATTVRRAAGVGVRVTGPGVILLSGRIEGSGGVGLQVQSDEVSPYSKAVRVTGGRSYGGEMPLPVLARMYSTPALQDSLRGNARDTLVVLSGRLRAALTVGPRLPLLFTATYWTTVDSAGSLTAQPGASLVFRPSVRLHFQNGGRLASRGSPAAPVVFTADDPAYGWDGLSFSGTATTTSYVTNTRVEYVDFSGVAVTADGSHRVIVDSSVIRQSGRAVSLYSLNSRLSRTRVDTTLNSNGPAVLLGANARMESTRIRAAAGAGLQVGSSNVVVVSCDIRDGDREGIVMPYYYAVIPIHNCNFVNNGGPGILNERSTSADATGNWWGSAGGPSGAGGDGTGGPVLYTPWRTTPYVLPYLPSF
jgi:hypothetical protein